VSTSLKAFLPIFVEPFGLTPLGLYERQKALIRGGVIPAGESRGPGKGLRLTPKVAATMLIALLSTENVNDIAEKAAAVASFKSIHGKDMRPGLVKRPGRCPFTGKTTFRAAMAELLASRELAERLVEIHVYRTARVLAASLSFGDRVPDVDGYAYTGGGRSDFAPGGNPERLKSAQPEVATWVRMSGDAFRKIAAAVAEGIEE
jgi:hypothetical protein